MNNYKELKVWQKSMDLVELVYKLTSLFPKEKNMVLLIKFRDALSQYLLILQKLLAEIQIKSSNILLVLLTDLQMN